MKWLDVGWVELYLPEFSTEWGLGEAPWQAHAQSREGFLVLAAEDARKLLERPECWTVDSLDGHVSLSQSESGAAIQPEEWMALAAFSDVVVKGQGPSR